MKKREKPKYSTFNHPLNEDKRILVCSTHRHPLWLRKSIKTGETLSFCPKCGGKPVGSIWIKLQFEVGHHQMITRI